jgi:hypothetical protein
MTAKWMFDDIDASRRKKGGNPSGKAFDGSFETFVRESLQNSNDAATDNHAEVLFDLIQLEGEDEIEDFKNNFGWQKFEEHLDAVAENGRLKTVEDFLERLRDEKKLRLLKVEDRHTEGLGGGEDDDKSNFTGLVKHELFSNKSDEGSGGNHGVGKSVYWDFSEIATVLFNSYPHPESPDGIPKGENPPRFFARTNLPSHEIEDDDGYTWEYKGSGWFGVEEEIEVNKDTLKRAVSVWDKEAENISKKIYTQHDEETSGTSITVVGFSEPTSEWREPAEVKNMIEDAAQEYFWAAMSSEVDRLDVRIRDEGGSERKIKLKKHDDVNPFVEAWNAYLSNELDEELDSPGDVVRKEFELELPDRSDGEETGTAKPVLLIRRADRDVETAYQNDLAMFRSPGMVVKYKSYNNISVGARPFHAVLVCGEAKRNQDITDGDRDFEKFLKNAEPPEHRDWKNTSDLKDNYKQGYRKLVKRTLPRKTREKLKDAVVPKPEEGERGPDRLASMFDMSNRGKGKDRSKQKFHFKALGGHLKNSRWEIKGFVAPDKDRIKSDSEVEIELKVTGEDGSKYNSVSIEEIDSESAETYVEDGKGVIKMEEGKHEQGADFDGKSIKIEEELQEDEIEMKISGREADN